MTLMWYFCIQQTTLARLVDFPTPLTPTNATTYGFLCSLEHSVNLLESNSTLVWPIRFCKREMLFTMRQLGHLIEVIG